MAGNEVFVLGAGFAKAVNSAMPLLNELSIRVREKLQNLGETLPSPLLDLGDDVELWLTYLSQPQPWLKEYHNLQNRALFLRITEIIRDVVDSAVNDAVRVECPAWLLRLVERWHRNKTNVITQNYDTLIERAALQARLGATLLLPDLYGVPFDEAGGSVVSRSPEENSFRLCKLHGSVNWFYSGAASFHGESLYYSEVTPWGNSRSEDEEDSLKGASDKVPLIVPPTSEKTTYFQHEKLRLIWRRAAEALSRAERVYFVGYSLPRTDLGIRFFLQHSRPSLKAPLIIVNTDKGLVRHYQELLGNSYNIGETIDSVDGLVGKLSN